MKLEDLMKSYEVKTSEKGGLYEYIRVIPNKPEGKELFIYNPEIIEHKYIPIDDDKIYTIDIMTLNEDNIHNLLYLLGEEDRAYYSIDVPGEGVLYYDTLDELMEDWDLLKHFPAYILKNFLNSECAIITPEDYIVKKEEMTEVEYDLMEEA